MGRPMSRSLSRTLSSPTALDDLFSWHFIAVRSIRVAIPQPVLQRSMMSKRVRLSTCFSGAGTIEIGMLHLKVACEQELGCKFNPVCVSACDTDGFCQDVLKHHSPHVFTDILSVLPGGRRRSMLDDMSPKQKTATLAKMKFKTRSFCCQCSTQCDIPISDMDMSGSPCVDWSLIGRRRKEHGTSLILFLCWGFFHVSRRTSEARLHRLVVVVSVFWFANILGCFAWLPSLRPLLVHENVMGFDDRLIERVFNDEYTIVKLVVKTSDVGFSSVSRRNRVYHIMRHRQRAREARPGQPQLDASQIVVETVLSKFALQVFNAHEHIKHDFLQLRLPPGRVPNLRPGASSGEAICSGRQNTPCNFQAIAARHDCPRCFL